MNYEVIADRDNGDDPQWADIEMGDRYLVEMTETPPDPIVRIERPVPTTDKPPTPDDATYADFERQEQELFRHQPVMSREDGGIVGCQCRDTFFRPNKEDWGTHLALVMRSLMPAPHPPTREQIAEAIYRANGETAGPDWNRVASSVKTRYRDLADAVLVLIQNGADR